MVRKNEKWSPKPLKPAKAAWYKSVWVIVPGAASVIGTVLYVTLTDGPTMLSNAEKIPAAFVSVKSKFLGWYYDDEAWSGMWSAFPEGYTDTEDMNLSKVDLHLDINAGQGKIGGVVTTHKICQALPAFDFVLVEGAVSGNEAKITVYDFIGGKRTDFAQLTLRREGRVMTVTPAGGRIDWFPKVARIGRHPGPASDGISSSESEPPDTLAGFCKRGALRGEAGTQKPKRRPPAELHYQGK